MLIKATRSRLHENCDVSGGQTDSEDQLEPLTPILMREAIERGLDRIEEVNVVFGRRLQFGCYRFHHITHIHTRNRQHRQTLSQHLHEHNYVVHRQRQR